jgi:hypothetical protein
MPLLVVSNQDSIELNITVPEEVSNNISLYENVLLEIE